MKMFSQLLFVICFSALLYFSAGCASATTWKATGNIQYTVHYAEAEKMANGDIKLTQNVTVKKMYLPYVPFPADGSDEKRIYHYPGDRKPENAIGYSFRLRTDHTRPIFFRQDKGILYFNNDLSSIIVNKLNPADINRMKQNPFIALTTTVGYKNFLIPYAADNRKNGEIILKCYSPLYPLVKFPNELQRSYKEEMKGAGITVLRIAMLPIPIVIDAATFPLQFLVMCLLHNGI